MVVGCRGNGSRCRQVCTVMWQNTVPTTYVKRGAVRCGATCSVVKIRNHNVRGTNEQRSDVKRGVRNESVCSVAGRCSSVNRSRWQVERGGAVGGRRGSVKINNANAVNRDQPNVNVQRKCSVGTVGIP